MPNAREITAVFGVVLSITLVASPLTAQLAWQQVQVPQGPAARYDHTVTGYGYVFGGRDADQAFDDMWVFASPATGWLPMPTATKPSPRSGHAMLGMLMFGGADGDGVRNDETWLFATNFGTTPPGQPFTSSWTQLTPAHAPSPRSGHAIAYVGQTYVLFGGATDSGYDAETWLFENGDWHQLVGGPTPPARAGHVMIPVDGGCQLLGGNDASQTFGDAWLFDGQQWLTQGDTPFAATEACLAQDNGSRLRHALLGGRAADGVLRTLAHERCYYFDDGVWIEQQPTGAMPPRESAVAFPFGLTMPYYVFGGRDAQGQALGDLWMLQATHPAGWNVIGSGCGPGAWGNDGPDLILPSLALGSTRTISAATATAGTIAVIGLQLGTAPAPLPCQVAIVPESIQVGLTSSLGYFDVQLHAPLFESLRGLDVSVQALAFEAAAAGGLALSKVGLIHLGD
ncbi:MAG: hypothetical protein H6835_05995 [Planctomycetes bacterium]|nr:hypothetical protein [Planctomycetota bacterium]